MLRAATVTCGMSCPGAAGGLALAFFMGMVATTEAAECVFPDNVNWVVNASCEISGIRIAPRGLSVTGGATLTVENTGELILDMRNFRIDIDPASRIVVENGGRIRSNQIGPLLVRETDDGTYGYFLEQVSGGYFDSINPDLSFHPSSTIKVLYMIEALRQVDSGLLDLNTTTLTSCPTTITPGPGQTCPNSFSTATSGGAGANCCLDPVACGCGTCCVNSPQVPNTAVSCGTIQTYGLGLGICAMMKVSNNAAANAIQESVGLGNPQTGWNNMLINAGAAIGLSTTSLASRMGCGGPRNCPNNRTTLRDLGRLYEQMTTDAAVLFPSSPPVPFVFENTDAYLFMENDNPSDNDAGSFQAIVDEQAAELGLDATTIQSFSTAVRYVLKAGSNSTNGCVGDPPCANANRSWNSLAGWVSLPIDGGAGSRQFVYGVFFDNATTNSWPGLRPAAAEMLRPVIRDALEDF